MTRRKTSFTMADMALPLLFLVLVLLLVTGCGSTTSTSTASKVSTTSTPGVTATSTSTTAKKSGRQSAAAQLGPILSVYVPALKNQIAQGLHLTATQLTQKIQAGQTLTAIASAQGLSATQLSALIASALSTSLAPAVKAGQLTQQQLERLTQRLQRYPNQLDTILAQ
jgi:hypothetical protein